MGKELVIASNRHETKVAILEDDQLVEVYFQRSNEYSLAGSIHKGRVTRVLPGMQSAFVDIGLERDAFLYVSDFFEDNEEYEKVAGAAEEKALKAERERIAPPPPAERPVTAAPPEPALQKPVPPPAAAPAPAPYERDEEGRDRRGRRSRRRRQRGGRGFPEAKYALPETGSPRPEPEPEPAAPPAEPEEFSVLPGESLAKYSHANHEEESAETGEGSAGAAEPEAAGETATRAIEEPLAPAQVEPEPSGPAAGEEPAVPVMSEEDEEQEEEAALEDPTLAMAPPVAEEPEPAPPPESATAEPATEELAEAEDEPSPVENGGPEDETGVPVAELPENAIPEEAMQGAAEPQDATELALAEQPAPGAEGEIEPARMPVSLTATLREQGYRYMHRTSRRMRRKMRGAAYNQEGPAPAEVRETEVRGAEAPPEHADNGARARHDRAEKSDRAERSDRLERPAQPSIAELLKERQEILVQIAKEPLGQKGARITSHIALPGRYVVYMPTVEHLGVSRKIASDEERMRLKRILQSHRLGMPGGFIVRTAGEGKSEDEIASDMRFLFNLWLDIRQKAEARPAPALIHHDLDLVSRILRDQMTETFKTVWVDNEEVYESVLRFVERFQPGAVNRVKLYTRDMPIFDAFNITSELEKALRPKVWLKSGGYIVINQTEALVAIDVNTGKFVGKSNRLEDTIVKTNTEAVKEIVRQVRLRDLGGIIVVDFIDMDERKNRQKVMAALEEAMRSDRAPNKMLQFNDFGLVAITRKRVKQSLERTLCAPCPYCEGAGYVKSVQTIIGEILQEAHKIAKAIEGKDVTLRVHPDVAKVLKSSENSYLEELEEILGRPVLVKSDPLLQQEKFDLV